MKNSKSPATYIRAASFLLLIGAFSNISLAAPGDVDLSFDPGSGVNEGVKAMALQPDGKLIIGGTFTTVKGLLRFSLARLHPDGSGDATFDAGTLADQYITAIAVQPDGKVIFTRGGFALSGRNVTRLNTDGSLDNSFVPAPETSQSVAFTCMALQPDGRIVLGGFTTKVDGPHSRLIRLNANGAIDNTFTNDDATFGGIVSCVAVQPDGRILIGGAIATSVNGTSYYNLIRLNANGTVDTNFNAIEGIIHSVVLQSDGKILLAGYGIGTSTNWNGVVRLNADGSIDGTFQPGTDANTSLVSLVVQPDGKVVCIGGYVYVNGTDRNALVRLNTNGSVDEGFNPTTGAPNNAIAAIAVQSDGRILIGGGFTLVNGTNRERLARLNIDGSLDNSFNPGSGINAGVNSLALQADGKVLIGGDFTIAGGALRNSVARLNANGTLDASFDPGTGRPGGDFALRVSVVALQLDGKILVGGSFSSFNGISRNRLVRLNTDGTVDTSFVPWIGAPLANYAFQPFQLLVQPDEKILVGGNAALASNSDGTGLARLNADGSFDTGFHPDTIGTSGGDYAAIYSLALQPDGMILAGGYVVQSGVPYYLVTRLNADGSRDNTFPAPSLNGGVTSIVLQPDGKILVASGWSDTGGWISRLNINGTVDSTFNGGSGADNSIGSVLIQADGKILIFGPFTSFNGTNCNHIARLNANGSLDTNFNVTAGANVVVNAAALQPDGNIIIGGNFLVYADGLRPYVARLYGDVASTAIEAWVQSYHKAGSYDNIPIALAVAENGNVVVTGTSADEFGLKSWLTVAWSKSGDMLWTHSYHGPVEFADEQPNAIAVDASGNSYVTGVVLAEGTGNQDYLTIKYASDGEPMWLRTYNGTASGNDGATAMVLDADGNVIVTGLSMGTSGLGNVFDCVTIKYSPDGEPLWVSRYNGPGNKEDSPVDVAVNDAGNVLVTGASQTQEGDFDYLTLGISREGEGLWARQYSGSGNGNDFAKALAVDRDGKVFVTGFADSGGNASVAEYATVAYSPAGDVLWADRYHANDLKQGTYNLASDVAVDNRGNVFVTGGAGGGLGGGMATLKYSNTGTQLWVQIYKGPSAFGFNDDGRAVAVDGSGNVIVTGRSYAENADEGDFATIAYSNAGVPLWTQRYNGPANGDDTPMNRKSLGLGPDGSVYVTGASDQDPSAGRQYQFVLTVTRLGCGEKIAAIAGVPTSPVPAGTVVTLDGSGSRGGPGEDEPVSHCWSIVSGNAEILGPPDGPTVKVKLLAPGEIRVRLTVDVPRCPNPATADVIISATPGTVNWQRCDCSGDGARDITDPIILLSWLFLGADSPGCPDACDCSGDRAVNITDAIFDLTFQFLGGGAPPVPYPACEEFPSCGEACAR